MYFPLLRLFSNKINIPFSILKLLLLNWLCTRWTVNVSIIKSNVIIRWTVSLTWFVEKTWRILSSGKSAPQGDPPYFLISRFYHMSPKFKRKNDNLSLQHTCQINKSIMIDQTETFEHNFFQFVIGLTLAFLFSITLVFYIGHKVHYRVFCPYSGIYLHPKFIKPKCRCSLCPNCCIVQSSQSIICCRRNHSVYLKIFNVNKPYFVNKYWNVFSFLFYYELVESCEYVQHFTL